MTDNQSQLDERAETVHRLLEYMNSQFRTNNLHRILHPFDYQPPESWSDYCTSPHQRTALVCYLISSADPYLAANCLVKLQGAPPPLWERMEARLRSLFKGDEVCWGEGVLETRVPLSLDPEHWTVEPTEMKSLFQYRLQPRHI